MKIMDIELQLKNALVTSLLLFTLSACSTMPVTNTAVLQSESSPLAENSKKIIVNWHINDLQAITMTEQDSLNKVLIDSLQTELTGVATTEQLTNIHIRADVMRVETVSESLNWLSTIALFIPLDRGGVAINFEAFNVKTKQSIAQLNYAQWTPLTEFFARFDRLEPAEIGMTSAASTFVAKLQKELLKGSPL